MLNLISARVAVSDPKPRYMVAHSLDQDRVTVESSILCIKQWLKHRSAYPHLFYRSPVHLIIDSSFYYIQVLYEAFQHPDNILNAILLQIGRASCRERE